jgi:polyisoprenoid-binding protein YceI
MKAVILFIAAMAAASTTVEAAPAVPKVNGKYAVNGTSFCSAKATTTQANFRLANGNSSTGVKTFNTLEDGILSAITGYITLKPSTAGATSGNATLNATQIKGPTSTVNAPSSGWSQGTINLSGAYSFTATTMTFDGDTWVMTYGNVINGVAHTVNLIRRETGDNPDCVDSLAATKQ